MSLLNASNLPTFPDAGTAPDAVLADLFELVAANDALAFVALHDALEPEVTEIVQLRLTDPDSVRHVTTAVFMEVWYRAREQVTRDENVRDWVLSIARRRAGGRHLFIAPEHGVDEQFVDAVAAYDHHLAGDLARLLRGDAPGAPR